MEIEWVRKDYWKYVRSRNEVCLISLYAEPRLSNDPIYELPAAKGAIRSFDIRANSRFELWAIGNYSKKTWKFLSVVTMISLLLTCFGYLVTINYFIVSQYNYVFLLCSNDFLEYIEEYFKVWNFNYISTVRFAFCVGPKKMAMSLELKWEII